MAKIKSYGKIRHLGHKQIQDLLAHEDDLIIIQEKIDGSFISFMVDEDHNLYARSKNQQIYRDDVQDLFKNTINAIEKIKHKLTPGWRYCGEAIGKPRHNTICYDRAPEHYVVIFDIDKGDEDYLMLHELVDHCEDVGFEYAPCLYFGLVKDAEAPYDVYLAKNSLLGNVPIEGIVVKNYNRFSTDGKVLRGKLVRPEFAETNNKEFRAKNPSKNDILNNLVDKYNNKMRWLKSIQRLAENDELTNSPQDIGLLIKSIKQDVLEECEDDIKNDLFKWAWPKIQGRIVAGFPEFYKEKLNEKNTD